MRSSRRYGALAAIGTALILTVAGAAHANAAPADIGITARPGFEMPFGCGQQWQGKTYDGHGDNDYALDLNWGSGYDDRGKSVVASASGVVHRRISSTGNHIVEIDHGGGWSTEYRHFDQFDIAEGIHVDQGDFVGRVGNSGDSTAPHLHYEQQYNNVSQHIYWHGSAITYYKGTGNGPTFTSYNCPSRKQYGSVSLTSRGSPGLDMFVRGSGGAVYHRNWNGSVWQWAGLGGVTIADPAGIATGSGRLDVFVLGTNYRLYVNTWKSGQPWSGWRQLSTIAFTSSPAVAKRYDGGIDIAIRGSGNDIYHGYYNLSTNAVTFRNLGGAMTSAPALLASQTGDRLTVFVRGPNGNLYSRMWSAYNQPDGWYSWVDHGVGIFGRPAVTSRGGYKVDVFYQAAGDDVMMHWYSPDGTTWSSSYRSSLGGPVYAAPGVHANGASRLDVFSRAADGDLLQNAWISGSPWTGWANRGAVP
ncbi:MAG: peptidoglycan DD-metalloendopeptidase family protein [Micromonosporaceae bacterium]